MKTSIVLSILAIALALAAITPHIQEWRARAGWQTLSVTPKAVTVKNSAGANVGTVVEDGSGWVFTAKSGKRFRLAAGKVVVNGDVICDAPIYIEDVNVWNEDDEGNWIAEAVKVDCTTFPGDDDSVAFYDYLNEHYAMPYVDWLLLEREVTEWVNQRYVWNLGA